METPETFSSSNPEDSESSSGEVHEATSEHETVENRAEAVEKIKGVFKSRLEERFGKEGKEFLPFHNLAHSREVARGSRDFLETIQIIDPSLVTPEDVELSELVGMAHDIVQNAEVSEGKIRERHRGFGKWRQERLGELGVEIGNEEASAEELLDELKRYAYADGALVFPVDSPLFAQKMKQAIGATYPEADFATPLPEETMVVKDAKGNSVALGEEYKMGPKFSHDDKPY